MEIKGFNKEYVIDSNLKSVWFRQPVFLRNTPAEPLTTEQQLQRSQWGAFLRSLSVFTNAAWMNYPKATYLAEVKPYQLLTAKQCGFKVPKTLITNDAETINTNFKSKMVIKSLDTVLLREGNDVLFTYTTIMEAGNFDDDEVSTSPLMAQEVLESKCDIRVTVVGNVVFAVKILLNGKGINGDWRVISKDNLQFEDYELSNNLRKSCLKLVSKLGLSFGGIDLIETPNGIFFIEINPTGEWAWLSNNKRNIEKSIAKWLSKGALNDL